MKPSQFAGAFLFEGNIYLRYMKQSRFAINLIFFFNGLIYVSWAARTPLIQETFGLSYDQLGYILLASSLGSVMTMPLAGFFINKFGSKIVTIIAACLFYLAVPLFSLSSSYSILWICFFWMGGSVGAMDVAMNAQAVEIEKRMNKPIMSFFHALFSIGMMTAAASVSLVEKLEIPLTPHLSIVTLIAFLALVFSAKHMISDDSVERISTSTSSRFTFPTGVIVVYGLIAFCSMLGEGAMTEWTANFMKQVALSSDTMAPIGLFSFSAAMTLGRLFGDRLRAFLGDDLLITLGGVAATLGLGICIAFPLPLVVILGLFVVGLGLSSIVPIVYSLAGNLPGIKAGVGISVVTTIGYGGFIFGPPIIGLLAEYFGLRVSWIFVLLLFVLMVAIVLSRRKRHSSNQTKSRAFITKTLL